MTKNSTIAKVAQPPSKETSRLASNPTQELDQATVDAIASLHQQIAQDAQNPAFWAVEDIPEDAIATRQEEQLYHAWGAAEASGNASEAQQLEYRLRFQRGLEVVIHGSKDDPTAYEAYRMNTKGMFHLTPEIDKKDKMPTGLTKYEPITTARILPVEMIVSEDGEGGKTQYVRLIYRLDGTPDFMSTTVPYLALTHPEKHFSELEDLLKSGITGSELKRGFPEKMRAIINAGVDQGLIKIIRGHNYTGWFEDKHMRAGSPGYAGPANVVNSIKGDAETWRNTCAEMVTESAITGIVMAATFASYMRGRCINVDFSSMIHLDGPANAGKSMAAQAGCSIHGYPTKGPGSTFFSSATTMVGMERLAASCHHGQITFDEIHSLLINTKDSTSRLVDFLNGGARGKAERGSEKASIGVVWNLNVITTGNTGILDRAKGHDQYGALQDRVLEINCHEHAVWPWDDSVRVSNYLTTLKQHHGHGYQPTLNYILANTAELTKAYDKLHRANAARLPRFKRKAQTFAMIRVGVDIMQYVLNLSDEAAQTTIDKLDELFDEMVAQENGQAVELETNVVEELLGFVNNNLSRFTVDGHLWPIGIAGKPNDNSQQDYAQENSQLAQRAQGGVGGHVVQKKAMKAGGEFSEIIFIRVDFAGKSTEINFEELARNAKKLGFLEHEESRLTKQKRGLGRCYSFNLTKALELAAQAATAKKAKREAAKQVNRESTANVVETANAEIAVAVAQQQEQVEDPTFIERWQELDKVLDSLVD
jgi:Domain of unknown function (DUF927)